MTYEDGRKVTYRSTAIIDEVEAEEIVVPAREPAYA